MAALKILLANEHQLMLSGMRAALEGAKAMEVVGEARSMSELVALAALLEPDIVVVDLNLPESRGPDSVRALRARFGRLKIAALSVREHPRQIRLALEAGADAYIPLGVARAELPRALLRTVAGVGAEGTAGLTPARRAELKHLGLTDRELEILAHAALGLSDREIGRALWVTEQTLEVHMANIFRKLRVTNRTDAARLAFAQGLAEAPTSESATAYRRGA
jgi:DNA-binding NarL/FixJ family response regulator